MAKKQKKKKDKKNKQSITTKNYINNFSFVNGDSFSRMNYLFRLSEAVYKQADIENNNNDGNNNCENNLLSSLYISIMKDISKRNAIRVNKYIKKVTCQKCNNLLFKDIHSEMKFINKNGKKTLQINCRKCNNISEIIYF